jgi:hypothetical protein
MAILRGARAPRARGRFGGTVARVDRRSVALFTPLLVAAMAAAADAPSARPAAPAGAAPTAPAAEPTSTRLAYYGGRVVSAAQLWLVPWGAARQAPYVTATGEPSVGSFLAGLGPSGYLAGLSQYGTDRPAVDGRLGTAQAIGPARFAGAALLTPTSARGSLDDAALRDELARQLVAGGLPAPEVDAAGNPVSVYLVFLPAGITVTLGGEASCRELCAYHGTLTAGGREAYYAVIPDMSPGSGCDLGCGGATPFENVTSVASHEIVEVITDPEVGLAQGLAPPLAWYDPLGGEIGDLCNGLSQPVALAGVPYALQRWWSNADGACVVGRGDATAVAMASPPRAAGAGRPGLLRTRGFTPRANAATAPAEATAPSVTPAAITVSVQVEASPPAVPGDAPAAPGEGGPPVPPQPISPAGAAAAPPAEQGAPSPVGPSPR